MESDDIVGLFVVELFALHGGRITMYLFKERSI
jgi:hypothetical protein